MMTRLSGIAGLKRGGAERGYIGTLIYAASFSLFDITRYLEFCVELSTEDVIGHL